MTGQKFKNEWLLPVGGILAALIFYIDLQLPLGVAGGVPYVTVVLLGLWAEKRRILFALAVLASFLTILGYFLSPEAVDIWIVLANRALALFAIWVTAFLGYQRKDWELEKALKESERRYRDFAEITSDWFWETDENHRFSFTSERDGEIFGLPFENGIAGKTRQEIAEILPGEEEVWEGHMADLRSFREFRDFEYHYRDQDGGLRAAKISGKPVFDDNDAFCGYRGTGTDVTARKKAEADARKAEARLIDAIENINEGFVMVDAEERIILCNSRYKEIYPESAPYIKPGVKIEDLMRVNLKNGVFPEAVGREEEFLRERLDQWRQGLGPIERKMKNGRWILLSDRAMESGEVVGIRTDITELKRREEEAQKANAHLIDAIESINEGFVLHDADDRIVVCNSQHKKFYPAVSHLMEPGAKFEDIVRAGVDAGIHEKAKGREEEFIRERVKSHRQCQGPIEQHFSDGRWLLISERRTNSGEIVGIRTDITELKNREIAIQDSQKRLDTIVELAPDAIISINEEKRIVVFNSAAERIFGYDRSDMMGNKLDDLLPREVVSNHDSMIDGFIQGEATSIKMGGRDGIIGRRKNGELFPAEASISRQQTPGGNVLTVMLKDVTERNRHEDEMLRAKEEAEIANRVKTEFLASVSHELRTPLNAILGFSQSMQEGIFGPLNNDKYSEYVKNIVDSGTHLLELINDVLDISVIESGRMSIHEEILDIEKLVQSACRLVLPRLEANDLILDVDVEPGLPAFNGDNRRLKQVILNILANSVKFTPEGGTITLSAGRHNGSLTVSIRDTGIGIEKDDIPKALSPFGQVDSRLSRIYEGTGLGLPLAKSFVELHSGELSLESEFGKGTVVTLIFPPDRFVSKEIA